MEIAHARQFFLLPALSAVRILHFIRLIVAEAYNIDKLEPSLSHCLSPSTQRRLKMDTDKSKSLKSVEDEVGWLVDLAHNEFYVLRLSDGALYTTFRINAHAHRNASRPLSHWLKEHRKVATLNI